MLIRSGLISGIFLCFLSYSSVALAKNDDVSREVDPTSTEESIRQILNEDPDCPDRSPDPLVALFEPEAEPSQTRYGSTEDTAVNRRLPGNYLLSLNTDSGDTVDTRITVIAPVPALEIRARECIAHPNEPCNCMSRLNSILATARQPSPNSQGSFPASFADNSNYDGPHQSVRIRDEDIPYLRGLFRTFDSIHPLLPRVSYTCNPDCSTRTVRRTILGAYGAGCGGLCVFGVLTGTSLMKKVLAVKVVSILGLTLSIPLALGGLPILAIYDNRRPLPWIATIRMPRFVLLSTKDKIQRRFNRVMEQLARERDARLISVHSINPEWFEDGAVEASGQQFEDDMDDESEPDIVLRVQVLLPASIESQEGAFEYLGLLRETIDSVTVTLERKRQRR
ncbi:hypothetical protein V5J35_004476 [Endozoicomonas sp. NE40]|uniref:Uncharacterized protein n=2 Tax=Endozoicomonas lisbonensis TaxID=3120522 RepID=A0ABV2SQ92_9GAMM